MAAKTNPEVIEGEYIDPDTSAENNGIKRRKRSAGVPKYNPAS